jgi:hypothetical protein
LTYALRVNIDDLRPWEYEAMPFWLYDEIRHAKEQWALAQRERPMPAGPSDGHGYTLPLQAGIGPQFVDVDDE